MVVHFRSALTVLRQNAAAANASAGVTAALGNAVAALAALARDSLAALFARAERVVDSIVVQVHDQSFAGNATATPAAAATAAAGASPLVPPESPLATSSGEIDGNGVAYLDLLQRRLAHFSGAILGMYSACDITNEVSHCFVCVYYF